MAVGGLQVGEATALRVEDVDLKAGTIFVHRNSPEVAGEELMDQPTKTGTNRTVDIPASLVATLTEHLNGYVNRFGQSALVFTDARGGPVKQSSFRVNIFGPAVKRAGIPAPAPHVHDLRHTSASLMGLAGYSLKEAGDQLGHSAVTMTERYAHVYEEARQQKVQQLDALLGGSGQ